MIVLDVNILVYAHRVDAVLHADYGAWLVRAAAGNEALVLTSTTAAGFLRVVTNPRVYSDPATNGQAIGFIGALSDSPATRWLEPSTRWWPIFTDLCRRADARGNLVPDAALAALAIEHGCRLATADRGFARFPGVQWFDPLDA